MQRIWARATLVALLLSHGALAADPALHVLSLSHRTADQVAPLLTPLLAADEGVAAAGDKLILRASNGTLAAVERLLGELDRPQASLLVHVRLQTRSANADGSALGGAQIRLGNDRASARALVVGPSANRSTQRVESSARLLAGEEAWIALQEVEPMANSTTPIITVRAGGSLHHRSGVRAELEFARPPPLLRSIGSAVRILPRLQGNHVVAEVALAGGAPTRTGVTTQSYQGTVDVPLGQWTRIAFDQAYNATATGGPTLTGSGEQLRLSEIWLKFDLAG